MMYRIEGIYDHRIIQSLRELGIDHFGFDFRPTSFNFLQQHLFQDLALQYLTSSDQVYLHFCNEKDFIITKIISETPLTRGSRGQVLLEFSDSLDINFYQKFNVPFVWHYRPDRNLNDFLYHPLFCGLVFDISFIEGVYEREQLRSLAINLSTQIHKARPQGLPLYLTRKWTSDVLPSFFEYFDFSIISLPIDSSVEVCYRNVDLFLFRDHFTKLQISGK